VKVAKSEFALQILLRIPYNAKPIYILERINPDCRSAAEKGLDSQLVIESLLVYLADRKLTQIPWETFSPLSLLKM